MLFPVVGCATNIGAGAIGDAIGLGAGPDVKPGLKLAISKAANPISPSPIAYPPVRNSCLGPSLET